MANRRRWSIAALWLWLTPLLADNTIILNTDIFPPYQIQQGEDLSGTSVNALECIFTAMAQPYSIRVMPWERAVHEVSLGRADGFFSAANMRRANNFAVLSAPLALEKWYWYSNKDKLPVTGRTPEAQHQRIGAIRGSNQVAWLNEQGYVVELQVGNTEQLLKLLEMGRIDFFIADQRTLRTELTTLPTHLRPQYERFQQYSTLGVYFSTRFLARRQDFMEQFNKHIFSCLPEHHTLTAAERERLFDLHARLFAHWPSHQTIRDAVKAQNRAHQALDVPQIMALDKQWREELTSQDRPLISSVAHTPLSRWLAQQQQGTQHLVTEIIVTDRLGLNVGISEVTSDYWQGDEAKFSEAFFERTNTAYQGQLEYDQSSQGFQIHISSQIRDPVSDDVIGVLIIGLDIQRALQANRETGDH